MIIRLQILNSNSPHTDSLQLLLRMSTLLGPSVRSLSFPMATDSSSADVASLASEASYGAVTSPIPAHQDHAQYGPYPTHPPHQASFAAPTPHPPSPFPPGQAYGAPVQGFAPLPPQSGPQPIYAGGYAPAPGPAYPAAAPAQYPAQSAYYPAPNANYAPQPQQYGYGQPQASTGYGAPPAASFGAFVPRTYLGTAVHPSDNPLLPPNEIVGSHIAVDGYDSSLMAREVEVIRKATKVRPPSCEATGRRGRGNRQS